MSSTNPLLGMAVYSLSNALELYQKNEDSSSEERRRFGAIILMDLSVEYVLKAKLYQINQDDFMDKQQRLGFQDCISDSRIQFLEGEKSNLLRVHEARNFSQHRGSIASSLFSQEYMKWLCKFVERFAKDNFELNMVISLPSELRLTWFKLTNDVEKVITNIKVDLKEPLHERYRTVKEWINEKRVKSQRGFLIDEYVQHLETTLKKYCHFLNMNPDQIIESAINGTSSPSDDLEKFSKSRKSPANQIVVKSFYVTNGIIIKSHSPRYKPQNTFKELSSIQLRKLCDFSNLEAKSWILANSYMGLKVGKLALLKVEDFRIKNWGSPRYIYPVKIRLEVSNTYDYTTFIGNDAKKILTSYFEEKQFSPEDHPWNYSRHCDFNDVFRHNCQKLGIYEKGRIAPKSLDKRLKHILKVSGMRHDWIYYLLGTSPERMQIEAPLDDELTIAYEKAYPYLRVYE
jgi:hypothetical protein